MTEPWFNPNLFAWIPGTLLGVLGGTWGGLAGTLAPKGRARGFVMGFMWLLLAASITLLVLGIFALSQGQPYGVWYGLGLAGFIGTIVIGVNAPNIARVYRQAEERRMGAEDLGR
jgi:hypothetical protein